MDYGGKHPRDHLFSLNSCRNEPTVKAERARDDVKIPPEMFIYVRGQRDSGITIFTIDEVDLGKVVYSLAGICW